MRKLKKEGIGEKIPTCKELVIHFLEDKDFILYHLTGIKLINRLDHSEAQEWTEESCKSFLETLKEILPLFYCDADLCPWCFFYMDNDCENCNYGKRHGCCLSDEDFKILYHKLCRKLGNKLRVSKFVEINEINKLVSELLKTYSTYY